MGWINKFRHTNLNNNKHNNKIEALQRQLQEQKHHPQPPHEDIAEKLKKYADLKQQGILTEEELEPIAMQLIIANTTASTRDLKVIICKTSNANYNNNIKCYVNFQINI